ncbi:MAG: hypothetical protein AAF975_07400, partial [Spirochaetota bacterium]
AIQRFTGEDVVRSALVRRIVGAYAASENSKEPVKPAKRSGGKPQTGPRQAETTSVQGPST